MPSFLKTKRKYQKIKGNRSNKRTFLFVFVFLMLFFLIIINFADLFSSLITRKGSLFSVNKIETASYSVYGVSAKDFKSLTEAENYAETVSKKGGAGYVYQKGECFVLVNAYQSLNEAQEIRDNLQNLGYNSRIVNIKVDAVSKIYRGNGINTLTSSINFFRNCYNSLYEECLNFDKNLSNKNQTNSVLAKVLTELVSVTNNLNALKSNVNKEIKNNILNHLKTCKELLENLLYSNLENLDYSSKIKFVSIQIVMQNASLVKNINEM